MAQNGLLLTSGKSPVSEGNIGKVLDFFGVTWATQTMADFLGGVDSREKGGRALRILCSAATFLDLSNKLESSSSARKRWEETVHSAFVYSDGDQATLQNLATLLGGEQVEVTGNGGDESGRYGVIDDVQLCGVMAGVRIRALFSPTALLEWSGRTNIKSIISRGEQAAFILARYREISVFVSTAARLVDLEEELSGGIFDLREHVFTALPIVLYVRWAFDRSCWQPAEINACLIIDDPLLKRSHGFVDFAELLTLMKQHHFSTNIAFIPWNWRRSRPDVVRLFLENPDYYSISVHGCDHTRAEFGSGTARQLSSKIQLALARMAEHQRLSGISHDRVMVFPQGVFSASAMSALKQSDLIAAVNNDTIAADLPPMPITIADVWDVAVMKYDRFPLFTRRYPWEGLENFAFDALLGKPVVLVIHHDGCRDHCRRLVEFIDRLNDSRVAPTWRSLGEVVRRSYRRRQLTETTVEVEMYATETRLQNSTTVARDFRIKRRESMPSSLKEIRLGSRSMEWGRSNGEISFGACLEAGESAVARLIFEKFADEGNEQKDALTEARIMLRRYLCEVRDNYVSKGKGIFTKAMGKEDEEWA